MYRQPFGGMNKFMNGGLYPSFASLPGMGRRLGHFGNMGPFGLSGRLGRGGPAPFRHPFRRLPGMLGPHGNTGFHRNPRMIFG